jgi:hypothetical protein
MTRTNTLEKLLFDTYSQELRLTTYAVLDAAQDEQIYGYLARSDAKTHCLLSGDNAAELADVAPYLVQLSHGSAITNWILSNWGKSWGIFVKTGQDADRLKQHLHQQTFAYDEKGIGFYLRYYDPRVLSGLLPTFSAANLEAFFGPVSHYYAEDPMADALLSFSRANGHLRKYVLPLQEDTPAVCEPHQNHHA